MPPAQTGVRLGQVHRLMARRGGLMELVEAFAETKTKLWKPIRTLEVFSETFPHVRGTITRNKTFASASLQQIIGPAFGDMNSLEITDLSSAVFLNKTARFEMRALPDASQLSPSFDLCSGDFDGDGRSICFSRKTPSECRSAPRVTTAAVAFCCAAMARGTSPPCRLSRVVSPFTVSNAEWSLPTSLATGKPISPWVNAARQRDCL